MTVEEELSEQKKAELRRIADLTWDAILATAVKFSHITPEQAAKASSGTLRTERAASES
jgi:hypothetical protein